MENFTTNRSVTTYVAPTTLAVNTPKTTSGPEQHKDQYSSRSTNQGVRITSSFQGNSTDETDQQTIDLSSICPLMFCIPILACVFGLQLYLFVT